MTKQQSWPWWKVHSHQFFLPTRTLVSSDCSTLPASRPGPDQAGLPGEGAPAVGQHGDQGAFADREAHEVGHQPRQPLERDRMHEPQIDGEGPQVWPERRTGLQPGRRFGPERSRCSVTRVTSGLISGSSMRS